MLKSLLIIVLFVAPLQCLTEKEIKSLKKELDQELATLQSVKTSKKSLDNDQKATVANDGEAKKKESTEADAALLKILQETQKKDVAKKNAEDGEEAFVKMLVEEQEKKEAERKKKEASSENNEAHMALLQLMVDEDTKKKEVEDTIKKSAEVAEENTCEDTMEYCSMYLAYCKTHETIINGCRRSCGACSPCFKDVWDNCQKYVDVDYCHAPKYEKILKKNCYQTCGHCRVHAPPACSNSVDGCCWDNVTFAENGCPACEDNSRNRVICKTFKSDCKSKGNPLKFMKQNCAVTCGFCDPEKHCFDLLDLKEDCKKWKNKNKCDDYTIGNKYCRETCGKCKKPK